MLFGYAFLSTLAPGVHAIYYPPSQASFSGSPVSLEATGTAINAIGDALHDNLCLARGDCTTDADFTVRLEGLLQAPIFEKRRFVGEFALPRYTDHVLALKSGIDTTPLLGLSYSIGTDIRSVTSKIIRAKELADSESPLLDDMIQLLIDAYQIYYDNYPSLAASSVSYRNSFRSLNLPKTSNLS